MDIELTITKIAFGGEGIGLVNGKTCFVEGVLPGERVLVKVQQDKKNFMRAKLLKVLAPSAHRVDPPCPYVSHCGGCQYQHVTYEEELKLKEGQVRELLRRAADIPADVVRSIEPAPDEYFYRNSVTLHVSRPKTKKSHAVVGFIGRDNSSVIPVKECRIADLKLAPLFESPLRLKPDTQKVTFKLAASGEIVSDETERFFKVKIGQESLLTSSKGFFQNNLAVTAKIASCVREWIGTSAPSVFFDLYSGVGTFSFLCASGVEEVICVEDSPASLDALRMNRDERGWKTLRIAAGAAERVFPELWAAKPARKKVVLVDPPRQGMAPDLVQYLASLNDLDGLVYISCDPATFARDLRTLVADGRLELREVRPFDMFPRTKHIELAAWFEKRLAYVVS